MKTLRKKTLQEPKPSETRDRPPEVQDLLERSTKKSKYVRTSTHAAGDPKTSTVDPEAPTAATNVTPPATTNATDAEVPATMSYKQSLTDGEQGEDAMVTEATRDREGPPAPVKKTSTRGDITKESYGQWMLVTRKEKRPAKENQKRPTTRRIPGIPPPFEGTAVYNNQLYNSRFTPLNDLNEDPLDGEYTDQAEQPEKGPIIRTKRRKQRKGGRVSAPRRAAAEDEHVVVRGSAKGKAVSRTVINHQSANAREPSSPLLHQEPILNVPPDEAANLAETPMGPVAMDEDVGHLGRSSHAFDDRMLV
nr:uncharacterized protein LOC109179535 isoform X2 [Ipomoea batatas]